MKLALVTLATLLAFGAQANSNGVCEKIHGTDNAVLLEYCELAYENFEAEQNYMGAGEKVKAYLKTAPDVLAKITDIAVNEIATAQQSGVLQTVGKTQPDYVLDYGVYGGIYCGPAFDQSKGDEDQMILPDVYDCQMSTGAWAIYAVKYDKQYCPDSEDYTYENEIYINFQVDKNGVVDQTTIHTTNLVDDPGCAG